LFLKFPSSSFFLDMGELVVPIRVAGPFVLLLVRLERIVVRPQQAANSRLGDVVPLCSQRFVEMADALGGPLQQAHRITLRVQERFQVRDEGRVLYAQAFPPPATAADTIARYVGITAREFRDPIPNGPAGGLRFPRHRADPAATDFLGFHGDIEPPLPFIECRAHQVVGRWCIVLFHGLSIAHPPS
jgi:hypothetical protein